MNLIDSVWRLTNSFLVEPKFIKINNKMIEYQAEMIVESTCDPICNLEEGSLPSCINGMTGQSAIKRLFLYEIIANSVNYCYWYGRYDIRSNNVNCEKMYNLLDESFAVLDDQLQTYQMDFGFALEIVIRAFINRLSMERFPLLDFRVQHLKEILNRGDLSSVIEIAVQRNHYSVEEWLKYLVTSFPGYGKDLFLKRAMLFIMQMYRRIGLFGEEIDKVLVPADYQIPKMLRWLGCIKYSESLAFCVDNNISLVETGQSECELRAATIYICKRLADLSGCTCEDVDTYLFSRRNDCKDPFHLVVTTNY